MTITDGRAETEAAMRPLAGFDREELVAQSGWVRAVARNLVRDPARAEDVAQETLLAALVNPPRDASDARRLRAWLARVAFNLSRLGSRQLARSAAREERVARTERVPSVCEELESAGTLDALSEALAELPQAYRDVIELRYFDGLSTAEIATRTGGSELAVRKRLWRARLRLRDALDREVGGEGGGARILAALLPWNLWRRAPLRALAASGAAAAGLVVTLVVLAERTEDSVALAATIQAPAARVVGESIGPATGDRPQSDPEAPIVPEPARRSIPPVAPPDAGETERETRTRAPRAAYHDGTVLDLDGRARAGVELVDSSDGTLLATSDALGAFRVQTGATRTAEARSADLATVVRAHLDPRELGVPQLVVVAPAFTLAGSVVGEDGMPVSGASIELACRAQAFARIGAPVRLESPVLRVLAADAAGRFAAAGLPRGHDLFVTVRGVGYEPLVAETLALGAEERFVLRARPEPRLLAGTVTHRDGRPAAGAVVRLGTQRTTTDARGHWELAVAAVTPETPLEATDKRAAPALVRRFGALLENGAIDGDVDLELGEPHDPVTGKLVGADPGGWTVVAFASGAETDATEPEEPVAETRSAPDGSFELLLPRGSYELYALGPGALRVASRAGLDTRIGSWEVALPEGELAAVAGTARCDDGRPLALASLEVRVRLDGAEGRRSLTWGEVASDALGAFAFPSEPDLALEIVPHHPLASARAVAFTAAGGAGSLALVAPRPAWLQVAARGGESVALLDAAGRPLGVHDPLGAASVLALADGASPVVEAPAEARWLEVRGPDSEPLLLAIEPVPGEVLRLRP